MQHRRSVVIDTGSDGGSRVAAPATTLDAVAFHEDALPFGAYPVGVWVTAAGESVRIADLDSSHLQNILRMLYRLKAERLPVFRELEIEALRRRLPAFNRAQAVYDQGNALLATRLSVSQSGITTTAVDADGRLVTETLGWDMVQAAMQTVAAGLRASQAVPGRPFRQAMDTVDKAAFSFDMWAARAPA